MKEHPPQANCPDCGLRVQTVFEHVDAKPGKCPIGVVAAAIRQDGKIYSMPPPMRHGHVIHSMVTKGCKTPITGDQGFLLSNGKFADRKVAGVIAVAAGQIKELSHPPRLYSEDMW